MVFFLKTNKMPKIKLQNLGPQLFSCSKYGAGNSLEYNPAQHGENEPFGSKARAKEQLEPDLLGLNGTSSGHERETSAAGKGRKRQQTPGQSHGPEVLERAE